MILQGDCLDVLKRMDANSFDGCLTDPPYGLTQNKRGGSGAASLNENSPAGRARIGTGFMGMCWDAGVPPAETWAEVLRVLKPGAFLLAFGGTRTYHRLACAIEDAGFEIRDCIMWLYGSGFPKHGSCLKPAWEPIIVARKSGSGLLNIDGCRIGTFQNTTPDGFDRYNKALAAQGYRPSEYQRGRPLREARRNQQSDDARNSYGKGLAGSRASGTTNLGRWPANVILDEQASAELDQQSGITISGAMQRDIGAYQRKNATATTFLRGRSGPANQHPDSGGASRFFYCAKASRKERGEGNTHPTVKPLKLTEYLARLILPPNSKDARLLVPFLGSGSEAIGAKRAGWKHIVGIEREKQYVTIARARVRAAA